MDTSNIGPDTGAPVRNKIKKINPYFIFRSSCFSFLKLFSALIIWLAFLGTAQAQSCPLPPNPGQCICHNLQVNNCPSGSGIVNGHNAHIECYNCTQDPSLPGCAQVLPCSVQDSCGNCTGCGNGVLDSGEGCDDGNNTSGDGCTNNCEIECISDAQCDDNDPCTDDSCNSNLTPAQCVHVNNNASCNDGVNCTQNDACSGGQCNGTPISCTDDGIACTIETCNEANGQCQTDDSGCECLVDADCPDDSNPCTDKQCDPATRSCVYPVDTQNSCDDGLFCDGTESCNAQGQCVSTGDPCANGLECANLCDENNNTCNLPPGVGCADDGNPCTDDQCNGSGACVHLNNSEPCNDGVNCTQNDLCSGGQCNGTPISCTDDGIACTIETCNEANGQCQTDDSGCECLVDADCPDDGNLCTDQQCDPATRSCVYPVDTQNSCDNGIFCDGTESCTAQGQCVSAGDPCVNGLECGNLCDEASDTCNVPSGIACMGDANPCTDHQCDGAGNCISVNNQADCDDQNLCTSNDTCSGGQCSPGAATNCDDNDPCTNDSCDPSTGSCSNADNGSCQATPCPAGGLNGNGEPCVSPNPTVQGPTLSNDLLEGSGTMTCSLHQNQGSEGKKEILGILSAALMVMALWYLPRIFKGLIQP